MTWQAAVARAVLIFVYFVVFTTWLPSRLLRLDVVASAGSFIRDGIALTSWFVALTAGLIGMRVAQRRGLI